MVCASQISNDFVQLMFGSYQRQGRLFLEHDIYFNVTWYVISAKK